MQTLTMERMQALEGGSWGAFFTGLSCGATAVGAIAAVISPDPLTKMGAHALIMGTITCLGGMATM